MTDEPNNIPIRKKRKKKNKNLGYLYLFGFVFLSALLGLSYIVKYYSPDIDVTIGNNNTLPLSEGDMDVEINSVDERLKWIQTEDEMPTVAVREPVNNFETNVMDDEEFEEKDTADKKNKEGTKTKNPPAPSMADIQIQQPDYKLTSIPVHSQVVPKPKPLFTKVYLGNYTTIEEAMTMQNKISAEYNSLNPFIKAINNYYVVQLGSFSDEEKAEELIVKLKGQGYNPKVIYEK